MEYQIDQKDDAGNGGLIIMIPGVLGYGDETHMISLSNELTDLGYSVIRFTPKGMKKNRKGFLKQYSQTNIYIEMKNILENFFLNNDFNRASIIPIGFSAGAPIAMKYASEHPVKAVINIVPPYQVTNGDDLESMDWNKGYISMKSSILGEVKLPVEYKEDSRKFNSLDYIKDVSSPKLFILGQEDRQVPNYLSKILIDKAMVPKEIHIIKGMGHKYKSEQNAIEKVNKIVKRFIRSL